MLACRIEHARIRRAGDQAIGVHLVLGRHEDIDACSMLEKRVHRRRPLGHVEERLGVLGFCAAATVATSNASHTKRLISRSPFSAR